MRINRSKKESEKRGTRDEHRLIESAIVFGAASHPIRLGVLKIVSEGPRTFTEIAHSLGMDASTEPGLLNYHLRKLLNAGLVNREGHTYELTDLGKILLSVARNLTERKQEEEMVGMKIEETKTKHVPGIKEFFRQEYGASEEWLGNIDRTYPMLINGRKLESEDSHILSLVALSGKRVVGFICGRIVKVDSQRISMSDLEVDDKTRQNFLKFLKDLTPDLTKVPEMSQENRDQLRETLVSRITEIEGLTPEELNMEVEKWKDRDKEAWIDVLWSIEHNEHFVKKRIISTFIEKAKEQGAVMVQTFLRNPNDAEIVRGLGFGKLDGEFHASFIGPEKLLQKSGIIYQIRLGKSMTFWEFAEGFTRSRTKITESFGDLVLTLDFSGLESPEKGS